MGFNSAFKGLTHLMSVLLWLLQTACYIEICFQELRKVKRRQHHRATTSRYEPVAFQREIRSYPAPLLGTFMYIKIQWKNLFADSPHSWAASCFHCQLDAVFRTGCTHNIRQLQTPASDTDGQMDRPAGPLANFPRWNLSRRAITLENTDAQ